MRYIFVDLEMNSVDKKYEKLRKVCSKEVIEIGAVALDENFREIGSFKRYVKPQFSEEVFERYEAITGITTKMLENEDAFETAFSEFIEWCGQDYKIYAWSGCDKAQISAEVKAKKFRHEKYQYMMTRWHDYQRMFDRSIKVKMPTSLENALLMNGLHFEGHQHDALCDARNTGRLFAQQRQVV